MNSRRKATFALCVSALCALAVPAAAPAKGAATQYLVSLGDSYAVGWQPTPNGGHENTTDGFVYQARDLARKRGYRLEVVNFGCGAATSTSMMTQVGCPADFMGPGARPFGRSQVAAATEFIRANRRKVALITVSIGGNDITRCLTQLDPLPCVREAQPTMKANVGAAARQLRAAAGRKPLLVGTTYPNVFLGAWVNPGGPVGQQVARAWGPAFKDVINPALKQSYAQGKGRFVDVTAKTGAYGDMAKTKTVPPYGPVPGPVAAACELTWACAKLDFHPNRAGYAVIAAMVASQLPRR